MTPIRACFEANSVKHTTPGSAYAATLQVPVTPLWPTLPLVTAPVHPRPCPPCRKGPMVAPTDISLPQRRSRSCRLAASVPHYRTTYNGSWYYQRGCRITVQRMMARGTTNEAAASSYNECRWRDEINPQQRGAGREARFWYITRKTLSLHVPRMVLAGARSAAYWRPLGPPHPVKR